MPEKLASHLHDLSESVKLYSGTRLRYKNVLKDHDYIVVYGGTIDIGGDTAVNKAPLKHTLGELTNWYLIK
ncbi:MAG TPA: hypothetical protein DCX01_07180 [Bacteroidetes bacterium]|nr:hypothetical protein [Bacteroidota bacterium]